MPEGEGGKQIPLEEYLREWTSELPDKTTVREFRDSRDFHEFLADLSLAERKMVTRTLNTAGRRGLTTLGELRRVASNSNSETLRGIGKKGLNFIKKGFSREQHSK